MIVENGSTKIPDFKYKRRIFWHEAFLSISNQARYRQGTRRARLCQDTFGLGDRPRRKFPF